MTQFVPLTPLRDPAEDEASLLARLGHVAGSGLSMVGNALDLPSSMLRDALTLNNPLDQLLHPFSHSERGLSKSGRDLLTQYGLAQENKETGLKGWLDDPMEAVRDLAGFGVEVGLDFPGFGIAKGALKGARKAAKTAPVQATTDALLNTRLGGAAAAGLEEASLLGNRIFRPSVKGRKTAPGQALAKQIYDRELEATQKALGSVLPIARRLPEAAAGLGADEVTRLTKQGRDMAEGLVPASPEVQALVQAKDKAHENLTYWGGGAGELEDVIAHFPRKMGEDVKKSYAKRKPSERDPKALGGKDPSLVGREDVWKGFKKGTNHVDEVLTDPEWSEIIAANPKQDDAVEALTDAIAAKYGNDILPTFQKRNEEGKLLFRTSAGRVVSLTPEQVAKNGKPAASAEATNWLRSKEFADKFIKAGDPVAAPYMREAIPDMDRAYARVLDAHFKELPEDLQEWWMRRPSYIDQETGERIDVMAEGVRGTHVTEASALADEGLSPSSHLPDIEYTTKTNFGRDVKTEILKPVAVDRYKELAKTIWDNPELEAKGLFTNHYAADAKTAIETAHRVAGTNQSIIEFLAKPEFHVAKTGRRAAGEAKPITIGDVLKDNGIKSDVGAERIAEAMGILDSVDPDDVADVLQGIRNTVIKPEIADELLGLSPKWKAPEEVGALMKMYESGTGLFKAGVLTWPARYVRDITSGMVRNWENGMFDFRSGIDAHSLLQGKTVQGLTEIPVIQEWVAKNGLELTDETASKAALELFGSMKASHVYQNTDMPGVSQAVGSLESLLSHLPTATSPKDVLSTALGRAPNTNLNPLDVRGVFKRGGELRTESKFGPAKAGDMVGQYTDNMNRLTPFLNQLKKGVDPAEAMKKIQFAQVDYSPRAYSKSEQALKRIFPFYSFSSRQIPYLAHQLATNPSGRLGQMIRAQRLASTTELPMPSYVGQTGAIPWSEEEDGTKRYITSLGLMHEDPLQLLGGAGPVDILRELASRANPIAKAPLELAAGQSFFQRGLTGGRDISEQDPPLGRLLTNLGLRDEVGGRAQPVIGESFEHLLANSPLSRMVSTAKTLTDPRKRFRDTILPGEALIPALTGARISDVSPEAQEIAIRQRADKIAKEELGARSFQRTYFPQDAVAEARASDPFTAGRIDAAQELTRISDRRYRDRKRRERAEKMLQAAVSP